MEKFGKSHSTRSTSSKYSLQTRLILIMLALTLVPLLALQYYTLTTTIAQTKGEINARFAQIISDETNLITQWAHERLTDIQTLAVMQEVVNFDAEIAQPRLFEYRDMWQQFESMALINAAGITEINTDGKVIDVTTRQYYIDGIAGNTTVSDPTVSKGTGNVVVINAVPVKQDQEVIGVIIGNVPVSKIASILADLKLGETGEAYLIKQDGTMVTEPKYLGFLQEQGLVEESAVLNYVMDTYASQQIQQGNSGTAEYVNYAGQKVIGAYTWIPSLRWGLVIEQNTDEIMAPIMRRIWTLVAVVVGIVLLIGAIVLLVSSSVVKPIRKMSDVADQLAVGNLNQIVEVKGKDEISLLARSFKKIIDYQRSMADTAKEIAAGNLSGNVTPLSDQDELGNAFLNMSNRLNETIGGFSESATNLDSAANQLAIAANQASQVTGQIATTIQQVAKGTTDQTSTITKTANAVEQMSLAIEGVAKGAQEQSHAVSKASEITEQLTNTIQQVASSAANVTSDSVTAAEAARKGSVTVEKTLSGMQSIKTKVDISAEKVQEMGKRSEEIGAIVETIEDIASQTNLLALNAAIEAARAGEHGKGFAVVADEVRKLAERSTLATKEIGDLIHGILATVEEAVKAMDEGAREVENGVENANAAGEALTEILSAAEAVNNQAALAAEASERMKSASEELVTAVDSVSAVVEENTASTEQMAANSGEVTQAIENIASVSEENSAAVEEVSAGTEEMSAQVEEVTASAATLSEMAQALRTLVAQFVLKNNTNISDQS